MTTKRRVTPVLVAAVSVAGGRVAASATKSSGRVPLRHLPHSARSTRLNAAQVKPRDLQSSFGALRRTRTSADSLWGEVLESTAPSQHDTGMEISQSRLVATTANQTTWLVPAARGLCIVESGTSQNGLPAGRVGCTSATAAEAAGLVASSATEFSAGVA
jgi:hypothetical protein